MEKNPFITSGYIGPEFFCDRETESKNLLSAIRNNRNITVIAPRRMGKSGLIWHVFSQINQKDLTPVYVDILPTNSLADFANILVKAIIKAKTSKQGVIKKIAQSLASVGIRLSVDPLSGEPSLIFSSRDSREGEQSIESILSYIKKDSADYIIAIDEFQQISQYSEKTTEAFLRSQFQNISNVNLIFSGSKKHLLNEIFTSPKRPFFGSSEFLELKKIDREIYSEFIMKLFRESGRDIDINTISYLLDETNLHTYYVQYVCNKLWGGEKYDIETLKTLIKNICIDNESVYANYLNLISAGQTKLLLAISLNRGIANPTSGDFISRYNLGAASSVNQSLHSLIDKELVYSEDGVYQVFDPLMASWFREKWA
jgi:hypothetical protein